MDGRLVVLKLFLDALGIKTTIQSLNERKLIQKAVYLGQLSGVDLGYRFGWYLLGPYSVELTQDYYHLNDQLDFDEGDTGTRKLKSQVNQKLEHIKPLLNIPSNVTDLDVGDWLELVASYDYLRRVQKKTHNESKQKINDQKGHLSPYIGQAKKALQMVGVADY